VDEHPSKIVRVLLDSVIERLNLLLVEKSQYALLELAASLARDDLHQPNSLLDRFFDDASKGTIDIVAPVVDLVQVQLELHDIPVYTGRSPTLQPESCTGASYRRDGGTEIAREGSSRFDPCHSPLASVLFEVVSPFELNRATRNEFSEALALDV
jgi:hypothetical protein